MSGLRLVPWVVAILAGCCPAPDAEPEPGRAEASPPIAVAPPPGEAHACDCPAPPVAAPTLVDPGRPGKAELRPPRPNPGSARIEIAFDLAHPERVRLGVFDSAGRLVRDLVNGVEDAGLHTETWDGRDDGDRRVAEGIYYVHLVTADRRQTRKVLLARP